MKLTFVSLGIRTCLEIGVLLDHDDQYIESLSRTAIWSASIC